MSSPRTAMYFVLVYILSLASAQLSAQDCRVQASLQGSGAQNLAYALQNVSCAVNTGYNLLFGFNNVSSVIDSSTTIVSYLKDSTTYLQASAPEDSAANQDIWAGPMNDFPFEFQEWADQIAEHKADITQSSALIGHLKEEKDAAQIFIDTVISKLVDSQKQDVKNLISPAIDYLNCAINALQSGSTATACSSGSAATQTSVTSGSNAASSGTSSASPTGGSSSSTPEVTSSQTSSASTASPTAKSSSASTVNPLGAAFGSFSFLLAYFVISFVCIRF